MKKRWRRRTAPDPDTASPALIAWAQVVDASQLSEQTANQAEHYLQDYRHMNAFARHELALRLVSAIETQVSPPPPAHIAPLDIFATVTNARRKQLGIG